MLLIDKLFLRGAGKQNELKKGGGQSINAICKQSIVPFQILLSALVFMIKEDGDVRITITNNFSLITVHV